MRLVCLAWIMCLGCRKPAPDPGFGTASEVFAAIERVCALGETIDKPRRGELWSEAKVCTPNAEYTDGRPASCRVELTKFAYRRAVRSVEVACESTRAVVSPRMMGDLAITLKVVPPVIDELVEDGQPGRSLKLTWSDGRSYLWYTRIWAASMAFGHIHFGVDHTRAFKPMYERIIGDEWEYLWNKPSDGGTEATIDPDDL